jgi:hypothetical protein
MDKTSLTLGWLVGRRIAGQRRTKLPDEPEKEPIGYIYGETYDGEYTWLEDTIYGPLPSEEEWNRTEYPYAVMYYPGLFTHILFVSKEPWHGTGEPYMYDDKQFGETIKNASSGLWFIEEASGDIAPNGYQKKTWKLTDEECYIFAELGQNKDTDGDGKYDYGAMGLINWSNHDILSADGKTVLITATDPIPVYA